MDYSVLILIKDKKKDIPETLFGFSEREDRRDNNALMCLTSTSVKWKKHLMIILHLKNSDIT